MGEEHDSRDLGSSTELTREDISGIRSSDGGE